MRTALLLFVAIAVHAQVPSGAKLFATYCSVGYCHGSEGRAGRGPRLRDREWDRAYLFKVIDDGIPNSSMPAWKGKLSNDQMHSIVAYILSISKEIVQTDAPREAPVSQPAVSTTGIPVRGGGVAGNSASGKNLFFDAANDRNCGVCHKVAGMGGDVGPDLAKLATETPREILKRILRSPQHKPIEIVMKDGDTLRGILVDENAGRLRVYDLNSPGPPVLRSLSPTDIASRQVVNRDLAHENLAATYTMKQLLDIVTYLVSPETPASVHLDDLF